MIQEFPKLQKMIEEKDDIENELKELKIRQDPFIAKDIDKNLIDSEGFPREDLDFGELTEFRNLKRRNAELQNDLKALMINIEVEMQKVFKMAKDTGIVQQEKDQIEEQQKIEEMQKQIEKNRLEEKQNQQKQQQLEFKIEEFSSIQPFILIKEVMNNSPAQTAGFMKEDLIFDFAEVKKTTLNAIQEIGKLLKENQGKEIIVKLIRKVDLEQLPIGAELTTWNNSDDYAIFYLNLVPDTWEGQGLLGCGLTVL